MTVSAVSGSGGRGQKQERETRAFAGAQGRKGGRQREVGRVSVTDMTGRERQLLFPGNVAGWLELTRI